MAGMNRQIFEYFYLFVRFEIYFTNSNSGIARVHDGIGESLAAVEQYKTLLTFDRFSQFFHRFNASIAF